MIPRRRTRPRMMVKESTVIRSPSFLKFVRGYNCACVETDPTGCGGKIEAAHVRRGTDGGIGLKPSDRYAIPLCSEHHAEQHRIGEQSFEAKYRFKMRQVADRIWRKWLTSTESGRRYLQEQAAQAASLGEQT